MGRPCLPPRDERVPPAPWQDNQAGGRSQHPPDGNGGHGGRRCDTGGCRVSPRRCGCASPAGRSSQAGGQWDPPFQRDYEYGGRGRDTRDRDGSPHRNVWAPQGCQGQGAQEPGGYGGGGFPPYRQPSPRWNWVPPGGQCPNQPGGFGPLREDLWPPGGQASREAGVHASRQDNKGPPAGHAFRPAGGHAGPHNNWGSPGGGLAQAGDFRPICDNWRPSPLAGCGESLRAGGGASPATGSGGNAPRANGRVPLVAGKTPQAGGGASPAAGSGGDAPRTYLQGPPAAAPSELSGGGGSPRASGDAALAAVIGMDECRRLLPKHRKPAETHHRLPVPAATRPARTCKCRRLVRDHRQPAAAHHLPAAVALPSRRSPGRVVHATLPTCGWRRGHRPAFRHLRAGFHRDWARLGGRGAIGPQ